MTKRPWWLALDVLLCGALLTIFGIWYLSNYAHGAWGDDSPGYIYTAGQIARSEPLVVQDQLTQEALTFFGEERLARFVTPAHHEIISPQGWIASRYPIGLSVIMAGVVTITHNPEAMYAVVPVAAVAVVVLIYVLAVITLPVAPALKRVAALIAAFSVGLAEVYANYAVAEPMREIPSMFFFLVSMIALYVGAVRVKRAWVVGIWLGLAGLAFGYSVNIRETSAVLLIPLIILLWSKLSHQNQALSRQTWLKRWSPAFIFFLGVSVSLSLTVWNSAQLTQHKEKFRSKDISRIAITSNFDHIQSLSPTNLLDNQGKFKPGVGGLQQYWQVLQGFSIWPPFLIFAVWGAYALWRQQRQLAGVYISWFGLVFLLFAMWINPYPRYILPLLPALAIVSGYGVVIIGAYLARWLKWPSWMTRGVMAVVVLSFFVAQRPAIADRHALVQASTGVYKAMTQADAVTLSELITIIQGQSIDATKSPLLMMFGDYKGGLAEMIMTNSNLRVIRFPGKPNEQPKADQLKQFLEQLQQRYTLIVWYDDTINAKEQQLLHDVVLSDPIITTSFSFQPNVTIYAITSDDQGN